MVHVLMAGKSRDLIEIAELLTQHGHHVTLIPRSAVSEGDAASFGHGALIAAPDEAEGREILLTAADIGPDRPQLPAGRSAGTVQHYEAGDHLTVPPGCLLRLTDGVIVLSAMHSDGAQVMIGMLGPNDFLLPHSDDDCHVEAIAQADVEAELFSWNELAGQELLASALALRVLRGEAWTAAQAHPYTEQRLLSILRLLAEQFGEDYKGGRLLRVRITQGQLAAITGATRPTVSRVMTTLRRRGDIELIGRGGQQRICIKGSL